jgi:hypothetical protein
MMNLNSLNSNKILIGIAMIMFNIGSKYLIIDISKNQEILLKHVVMRRITLFCIFFVATRDVFTSLILTSVFVLLAFGLFNEDSKICILPKGSFYDNVFTKEEYEMSKKIISGYEKENVKPELRFCNNK